MTANKIGAVVLAAALIVGAVFLRQAITSDDDNGGSTDPSSPTDTLAPGSGSYQLICSTEFTDICRALDNDDIEVAYEPAGTTLQALSGVAPAELPDAWLTLDPFPAMLAETRQRPAGLPTPMETTVVASTQPALAVKAPLAGPIVSFCDEVSVWACLGGRAGSAWSSVDIDFDANIAFGLPDPSAEASGVVQFANALLGYFPDTSLEDRPWADDATFMSWKRTLANGAETTYIGTQTPLSVLSTRAQINLAATTHAEVDSQASSTNIAIIDIEPSIEFSAVLATFNGADRRLATALEDALAEIGWDPPSGQPFPVTATTFIAIRNLWRQ